jgi:hypothetical protein
MIVQYEARSTISSARNVIEVSGGRHTPPVALYIATIAEMGNLLLYRRSTRQKKHVNL